MVMYDNNMIMSLKQKKKFEPSIKLSHNINSNRFSGLLIIGAYEKWAPDPPSFSQPIRTVKISEVAT